MDIPTYASILNRKLVLPSDTVSYLSVNEHFMLELMLPLVDKIRVDEKWYLAAYSDVGAAVAAGTVTNAKMHYCRFGYYEHRMPYKVIVKESWYVNQYPDVKDAVAAKRFLSGQEHFELQGYREGRFPHPGFRLDVDA
jgi:hypothetical protein